MAGALGLYIGLMALGVGLGLPIAAAGCGLGQGRVGASAVEAIARQPEASGKIQIAMIIALALIESLAIYALLISLILIFVVGLPKVDWVQQMFEKAPH